MVKVMILDEQDKRTDLIEICRLDLKRSHMERLNFRSKVDLMVAEFIFEYKHKTEEELL